MYADWSMSVARSVKSWPIAIVIATVLTALSSVWLALFALGAFAALGMSFFEAVGIPMQLSVIALGFFLMVRLFKNRPDSMIRSVPTAIRIVVPVAMVVGAVQLALIPAAMPATTPSGKAVRSFNASVEDGVCVAVYNELERVPQSLDYCSNYQSEFNRTFAGAWLLFAALELWGAWAIYGAPSVQRVHPDRQRGGGIAHESVADSGARPSRPYVWTIVRALVLVCCAISGWRGLGEAVPVPGSVLAVAAIWGAIMTRYWIVQEYTSIRRVEPWMLPSWFLNPFQLSQPFQFFQLAGFGLLALGFSQALHREVDGRSLHPAGWPVEALAGAFGIGILLGIHWATRAYRSRFQRIKVL